MLDIKFIRNNVDLVKKAVKDKNGILDVEKLLEVDKKRSELIEKVDSLRTRRNQIADKMRDQNADKKRLIAEGRSVKEEIQKVEDEVRNIEKIYTGLMYLVPQIPADGTPLGKDDKANVEVKKWGNIPKFDFDFKDHIELGRDLDLIDIPKGVRTSGYRGYYLKNEAVLLHMGLMMMGLNKMIAKGYTPFIPPTLVKDFTLFGSGHFPIEKGSEIYEISNPGIDIDGNRLANDLYLTGTSEPPILAYHKDEILDLASLPRKYCGFSQCYRSEVGSYGKDTKGIYRIHEFMKIEQLVFCEADYKVSEELHKEMLEISEEMLQELEIPYHIVQCSTGDMGLGKYKMFDIESWMPSRGGYGETHSASNLGDWQARRLNIKYKDNEGKKRFVHTLNNTVIASPRILISILELNQQKDGSVKVPKALQGYVGKDVIKR